MLEFLVHLLVSAGLLFVVGRIVNGVAVESGKAAILGALVLGIANAIVRPIVVVLTLPITIITIGLFLFVVNAAMFGLAAAVVPGFKVKGPVPALVGSLLLSLMNWGIAIIFGV
jgi:putative membrane protein